MQRRILSYLGVALGSALLTILIPRLVAEPVGAQPGCQTFPETGKTVCGTFLQYWQTHGGLAQQGFPITNEFSEVSDLNGKPYTVQYFERAVFELHPENAPPYNVLLSQLGTFRLRAKYQGRDPSPPRPPAPTPLPSPTATTVADEPPPRISLADFKALYDNPAKRPLILDVRAKEAYDLGHIKGAISFPEADVDARVNELPRNTLIVAYCQ